MADVARDFPLEPEHVLTANVRLARIARVYAEALFSLAAKTNEAESTGAELESFVANVLHKDARIALFFKSPALTRKARQPILDAALKNNASPLLSNFLRVLNRNNRLDLVDEIAAAYHELLDQRASRVRVTVRSAVSLTTDQQADLRKSLADSLKKEPVLTIRVEPDLLGGLVVQVGDKVYDSSVRARLDALRTQLTTRGSNVVKA
jgi:F-type H+-transporting ATPase subunit delta